MAGWTDAFELNVLRTVFLNGTYDYPTTVYVGYATVGATECTDVTYARQSIAFSSPASGACYNSATITFPAVTATHNSAKGALFTAATAGEQMTDWIAWTAGTVSLVTGQQFRIPAGDYDLLAE